MSDTSRADAANPGTSPDDAEAAAGFDTLGLGEGVLRAIADVGYNTPTPIQAKAIPLVLQGRDVLGCAQTGTGKTASFTMPMIEILAAGRARARMPRSLILTPTRELAAQVDASFQTYGRHHKLSTALLVGGESVVEQTKLLNRGVHVLIATPGRLIDLFERGAILLNDIRIAVLDECDRMLDMGFIPDIERIFKFLPDNRQTLMFSATLPPEIRRLADQFLTFPTQVSVAPPASPAATVTQWVYSVAPRKKPEALRALLAEQDIKAAIIFCNRKTEVARLHRALAKDGFNAGALHGDMSQPDRTATLARFKNNEITFLVCSDVAARGLDIPDVSHVFNYDVPHHAEDYVHRIGRTGRAGRSGWAATLATADDAKGLAQVERLIGKPIPEATLPGETAPASKPENKGEDSAPKARSSRTSSSKGKAKSQKKPETAPRERDKKPEARPSKPKQDGPKAEPDSKVAGFGDDVPDFFKQG